MAGTIGAVEDGFDRGVRGCRPRRLEGPGAVTSAHGERLASLAGRTVRGVELLVCRSGDLADGMVAVALDLGGPFLVISDGLEENRVEIDLDGLRPGWERHPLRPRELRS